VGGSGKGKKRCLLNSGIPEPFRLYQSMGVTGGFDKSQSGLEWRIRRGGPYQERRHLQ